MKNIFNEFWTNIQNTHDIENISVSFHVDENFQDYEFKKESLVIENCIKNLNSLVEICKMNLDQVKPALIFPLLSESEQMDLNFPRDIQELRQEMDDLEPPSFALVSRKYDQYANFSERYIRKTNIFDLGKNYHEFYQVVKSPIEGDFGRYIYIEYYPDGFLQ